MRQLLAAAAAYKLTVHGAHLEGDMVGCYVPELSRIYFDLSLTLPERRSVIAHELGHAHYGHDCEASAFERQADMFAAQLLIDPDDYARLERINHDAAWIADELNVAAYVVDDYRRYCLRRMGSTTYVSPRLGAGQWAYRARVL